MVCVLILLDGMVTVETRGNGFWEVIGQKRGLQQEFEGRELWRRSLGRERSLLLYIDEEGELQMSFTDGPWVYLTEELVEEIKAAGMRLWESEKGR